MDTKIVRKPAFMVVGMSYVGNNQNQEIAQLWGQFNPRSIEIKNILWDAAYGVCIMKEGLEEGAFEYVAGYEVNEVNQLPEGMVARLVPESKYIVFEHKGTLDKLRETYDNVFQVLLPQSGQKVTNLPTMEVYDEKFLIDSPESVFYIYVPIE
jgi:AraC family transcriptional regulator